MRINAALITCLVLLAGSRLFGQTNCPVLQAQYNDYPDDTSGAFQNGYSLNIVLTFNANAPGGYYTFVGEDGSTLAQLPHTQGQSEVYANSIGFTWSGFAVYSATHDDQGNGTYPYVYNGIDHYSDPNGNVYPGCEFEITATGSPNMYPNTPPAIPNGVFYFSVDGAAATPTPSPTPTPTPSPTPSPSPGGGSPSPSPSPTASPNPGGGGGGGGGPTSGPTGNDGGGSSGGGGLGSGGNGGPGTEANGGNGSTTGLPSGPGAGGDGSSNDGPGTQFPSAYNPQYPGDGAYGDHSGEGTQTTVSQIQNLGATGSTLFDRLNGNLGFWDGKGPNIAMPSMSTLYQLAITLPIVGQWTVDFSFAATLIQALRAFQLFFILLFYYVRSFKLISNMWAQLTLIGDAPAP